MAPNAPPSAHHRKAARRHSPLPRFPVSFCVRTCLVHRLVLGVRGKGLGAGDGPDQLRRGKERRVPPAVPVEYRKECVPRQEPHAHHVLVLPEGGCVCAFFFFFVRQNGTAHNPVPV